jgi:hypothetical protein
VSDSDESNEETRHVEDLGRRLSDHVEFMRGIANNPDMDADLRRSASDTLLEVFSRLVEEAPTLVDQILLIGYGDHDDEAARTQARSALRGMGMFDDADIERGLVDEMRERIRVHLKADGKWPEDEVAP